jgi:hypothetical protein
MIPIDEVDPAFRAGLDRYGVGAVRSLSDYYDFAGLKVLRRAATSRCPGGRDR